LVIAIDTNVLVGILALLYVTCLGAGEDKLRLRWRSILYLSSVSVAIYLTFIRGYPFDLTKILTSYVLVGTVGILGTSILIGRLEWGSFPSLTLKFEISILGVTVGPVVEEIIFRGFSIPFLMELGYPSWQVLACSAGLFSAQHIFRTDLQSRMTWHLAETFLAGLILAYIYTQTWSLITVIVVHALWNFINDMLEWP